MARPVLKLQLRLEEFDERPFVPFLDACIRAGIEFTTMAALGDSPANRRRLYELNKECSQDIPGRGEFYTFDDYQDRRIERPSYNPAGVIIARDGEKWVGMSALSDWRDRGFAFAEMTGVLRQYRRRGLAIAMKILTIRFARTLGVDRILTFQDAENAAPIALNRSLGFVPTEWESLFE